MVSAPAETGRPPIPAATTTTAASAAPRIALGVGPRAREWGGWAVRPRMETARMQYGDSLLSLRVLAAVGGGVLAHLGFQLGGLLAQVPGNVAVHVFEHAVQG